MFCLKEKSKSQKSHYSRLKTKEFLFFNHIFMDLIFALKTW